MDCHYIPTLLTPVALLFRFLRSRGGEGDGGGGRGKKNKRERQDLCRMLDVLWVNSGQSWYLHFIISCDFQTMGHGHNKFMIFEGDVSCLEALARNTFTKQKFGEAVLSLFCQSYS